MSISCDATSDARLNNLIYIVSEIPGYQTLKASVGEVKYSLDQCAFGAYSELSNNHIHIDPNLFDGSRPKPAAIQAVLFEMANLYQKNDFRCLVRNIRSLSPDSFVEKYEGIEHQSALICKKILRSFFPQDQWTKFPLTYTPDNFRLHYLLQQLAGHSGNVYQKYRRHFNSTCIYLGTFGKPIAKTELGFLRRCVETIIVMQDPDHPHCKRAGELYLKTMAVVGDLTGDLLSTQVIAYIREIEACIPKQPNLFPNLPIEADKSR